MLKRILFAVVVFLACTAQLPWPNVQPVTGTITASGGTLSTFVISNRTATLYSFSITCPPTGSTVSGGVTITGLATGSLAYTLTETTIGVTLQDYFPPIPGSAPNTPIVLTVAAISSGVTCNANMLYGFQPAN